MSSCQPSSAQAIQKLRPGLVWSALILLAQSAIWADTPPQPGSTAGNITAGNIVAQTTQTSANSNSSTNSNAATLSEQKWDAGSFNALDAGQLRHNFSLKNAGTTPITISRFQASCGCTSAAAATSKGPAVLPLSLAPGQSMTVVVTVDLAKVAPGPVLKSVMVYMPDGLRPVAEMQITGTLRPSLSLSAPMLDFGTVPGGQDHALNVTATWDERLTPGGTLPSLVSTNPDVTVTPQPEVVAASPKTPGPSAFLHQGIRTRSYQVSLSKSAPLGPLSGVLSFQPLAAMTPTVPKGSSVSQALRAAILAQPTVLLLGQVQGELAAQPQTLLFGRVLSGQPATREIVLTGTRPEALKTLSVSTASPWISAHLSPSTPVFRDGQLQSASQVVEVSLRPDAPPGLLSSTLKVTLANGQHLRVPVTVDIGR